MDSPVPPYVAHAIDFLRKERGYKIRPLPWPWSGWWVMLSPSGKAAKRSAGWIVQMAKSQGWLPQGEARP